MARAVAANIRASLGITGQGGFTLDTAGWTGFTAFGWFKTNVNNGLTANMLVRSAVFTDRAVQIQTDGRLRFALACATNNLSCFTLKSYPKGIWHHFVATYNGTIYVIYIDGSLDNTGPDQPWGNLGSGQGTSWAISNNGNNPTMSQFGIYNRAVTASEAKQIYMGSVPTSGLQRYWPMNEGAGTILNDLSGNGGNGTVGTLLFTSDTPSTKRAQVGGNMLINGDFSYVPPFTAACNTQSRWIDGTAGGSSTNSLFGWAIPTAGYTSSSAVQFDTSTTYNGNASLKLSTLDVSGAVTACTYTIAGGLNAQQAANLTPCQPNTTCTLSAMVKTNNVVTNSAYLDLREFAGDGSTITTTSSNKLSGTNNFTLLSVTVTTSATTRYLMPLLRNNIAGNISDAWFADVRLLSPTTRTTVQDFNASLVSGSISPVVNSAFLDISTTGCTVAGWFRPGASSNANVWQFQASGGLDAFRLNIENTGKLFTWHVNSSASGALGYKTATSFPPTTWQRILVTYDGAGTSEIFVNGVSQGGGFSNIVRQTDRFVIFPGNNGGTATKDVRIYPRKLTATEIAQDYAGTVPSSPVLRWSLGEGAGSNLLDSSGNGLNTTGSSMLYTTDVPTKKRTTIGDNLVANGDFEYAPPFVAAQTSNGAWIDGTASGINTTVPPIFKWRKFASSTSNTTQFDTTQSFSGTTSLKLFNNGGSSSYNWVGNDRGVAVANPTLATLAENGIVIKPNTSYTLSFAAKSDITLATNQAGIEYRRMKGDTTLTVNDSPTPAITTSWQTFSYTFTTVSSDYWLSLIFKNGRVGVTSNQGNIWYDNIVVVETTPTTRATVT